MTQVLRIEIADKIRNVSGDTRVRQVKNWLGIDIHGIEHVRVYKIETDRPLADLLPAFVDPVLQQVTVETPDKADFVVEVSYRPGVTDNAGKAASDALAICGITARVSSGSVYYLEGVSDIAKAEKIAAELLANRLIEKAEVLRLADFKAQQRFLNVRLPEVQLSGHTKTDRISLDITDPALEALSRDRCLALTVDELAHIRTYFSKHPTDVELEIIAQSWSEHCKHKIFSAEIEYEGVDGHKTIDSLYKTYIKSATREIERENKIDWLVSVFSDNAGIVRFDPNIDLCIKVETHNSPSALDPYGGALTGILGVNRDILGAGLGARPIANLDVFCLAPPDMPRQEEVEFMPKGVMPPRRVLEGVHRGVEDGGNKSGIPTVGGAFFFDRDYAGKPLVYVGTVGVMPQKLPDGRITAEKMATVGDRIVMVGGAIGADGVHGATFSSLEINDNAPATAVQIGDPVTQKRMADFLLEARDQGLYSAVTDNGAGGLSSSVGEMAQMTNGADIDLILCPVKYPGLQPWELMVSESQERMTVAVPPECLDRFMNLAKCRNVVATDIGVFTDKGNFVARYDGDIVANIPLSFLHDSLPQMKLKARWFGGAERKPWSSTTILADRMVRPEGTVADLVTLLASLNITSREKWIRSYDHEVQASSAIKPFLGKGPADGALVWLHPHGGEQEVAIAIGCGLAPRLSLADPYLMAVSAVDEAVRNIVVAGGNPDMCCLLDNFCWPDPVVSPRNPDGEYRLGQLVRACEGLYAACKGYGMPLVSGKDSMKNDFRGKDAGGRDIAIGVLPTLLVTAMAKAKMGRTAGSHLKKAGDLVFRLGAGEGGIEGSEYAAHFGIKGDVCVPDIACHLSLYRMIYKHLDLFSSLHDVSEGGFLTALAESAIGGGVGVVLETQQSTEAAFGEGTGMFVATVSPENAETFASLFAVKPLGVVTSDKILAVNGHAVPLADLEAAWHKGF